jgi:hypothetical protein
VGGVRRGREEHGDAGRLRGGGGNGLLALARTEGGRCLRPELVADRGEPAAGAAVDHGDGVGDRAEVLAGDADGEVVEPVAVEGARREGGAEDVEGLGVAGDLGSGERGHRRSRRGMVRRRCMVLRSSGSWRARGGAHTSP